MQTQKRAGHSGLFAAVLSIGLLAAFTPPSSRASQPLETETARFLEPGSCELEGTVEYQTSREGSETSVPGAIEYGVTRWFEILIEPVAYTAIRPKSGANATGAGDTEVTMTFRLRKESQFFPALATAAEIKFATANDTLIGTRKTDYAGYFIATKQLGQTDIHANIAYTVLGAPAGVSVNNIWNFALAGEWHATKSLDLVAEYLQNTSSSAASESPDSAPVANRRSAAFTAAATETALTPELAGGEKVGMIGMRYRFNKTVSFAFGVTYDNSHAVLYRPGVTIRF